VRSGGQEVCADPLGSGCLGVGGPDDRNRAMVDDDHETVMPLSEAGTLDTEVCDDR
jgi:hypothetical protein